MKVNIIGSGFSSLASACYLAKDGYQVNVFEKNETIGGRACQFRQNGFLFDMGPTIYWMPDVFESFFEDFGKSTSDYYELIKLDPAYKVVFGKDDSITIGDNLESIIKTFEQIENGSGKRLRNFIQKAKSNYDLAIKELVYQPGENLWEIITPKTALKLPLFVSNIKAQVERCVKDERLRKIMEFPVLLLGARAADTPAFYNFMNYSDFGLGTWHPVGGMHMIVRALQTLAEELGVNFHTNSEIKKIRVNNNRVTHIATPDKEIPCDILLSGADYAFTEQLLDTPYRQYSDKYWDNRVFAPSALMFYVAFDTKLKNVAHHTLFFDTDFETHEHNIYTNAKWPKSPLFYASFSSVSDNNFAPNGKEAATFLIPIAPDLEDSPEIRAKYFEIILDRLELFAKQSLRGSIQFYKSFCVNDFKEQYNSYKGNAYGLANTLLQTHYFRPKVKNQKLQNLYHCGQLTVPGPGVPPSLISGKIASQMIQKYHPL